MARHGWIDERPGKKGPTFRVNYFVPDATGSEVRKSKSFSAKAYGGTRKAEAAAKAFLAEHTTKVRDGSFVAPSTETVMDLIERWLRTKVGEVKPSSILDYRSVLRHLPPELANANAQAVRPKQFQDLYNDLKDRGLTATVKQLHTVINAAFALAHRLGDVRGNPVAHVRPSVGESRTIEFWTPDETAAFLAASADDPLAAAWRLLALTGMRVGECFALTWDDIDLERGTISITKTVTRNQRAQWIVGATPKTNNSRRVIPLPPSCADPLRRHRIAQAERRLAAGRHWSTEWGNLVFDRGHGLLITQKQYSGPFFRIVVRAPVKRITPHGLRHTFATAMLLHNVHPKVVAELLGDDVSTVLQVYSHVTVGARQEAVAILDGLLSGLVDRAAMADATTPITPVAEGSHPKRTQNDQQPPFAAGS